MLKLWVAFKDGRPDEDQPWTAPAQKNPNDPIAAAINCWIKYFKLYEKIIYEDPNKLVSVLLPVA